MANKMDDDYSLNNHMTFTLAKRLKPFLQQAAETALNNIPDTQPFTYCDFGVADGGMAAVLAKHVVGQVQGNDKGHTQRQINVVFEDQPSNDFSSFFEKFQHEIGQRSDESEDVFVSAVGRSFYRQCLPKNSVDVAMSSTAAHWLDMSQVDASILPQVRFIIDGLTFHQIINVSTSFD